MERDRVVRRDRYRKNGVPFSIVVVEGDGAYAARWHCVRCGEAGARTKACRKIHEAVLEARSALGGHACPR